MQAFEGEVTIRGKVLRLSEVEEIERVAGATTGVTAVHLDELMSSTRTLSAPAIAMTARVSHICLQLADVGHLHLQITATQSKARRLWAGVVG